MQEKSVRRKTKGSPQIRIDKRRPTPRHFQSRSAWWKSLKVWHWALLAFVAVASVAALTCAITAANIDHQLAFSEEQQKTLAGKMESPKSGEPFYVLLLGTDARSGEKVSRTDAMMLVRVDLATPQLTIVSIPRDTLVELEGEGTQKINAAYAFGGVGGAVDEVSKLMGVPISHVAVLHFDELVGLVDYLGGITVDIPVPVNDPDVIGIELDAGVQTLDGVTALRWVRVRHGFLKGDFQRQEDQRILFVAIMERLLSLSPGEVPGAISHLSNFVSTDMSAADLLTLYLRLNRDDLVVYTCSIPSTLAEYDGVSYVIVKDEVVKNLMEVVDAGGDPSAA